MIRQGKSDLYKIGYTAGEAEDRLMSLQIGSPVELHLVFVWNVSSRPVEKQIHSHFYTFHVRGEWFKLREDQVTAMTLPEFWRGLGESTATAAYNYKWTEIAPSDGLTEFERYLFNHAHQDQAFQDRLYELKEEFEKRSQTKLFPQSQPLESSRRR